MGYSLDETVAHALELTVEPPVRRMYEERAKERGCSLREVVGDVLRQEWVNEKVEEIGSV